VGKQRKKDGLEDNIKIDLEEVTRGCIDFIDLALDKDSWRVVVNAK
jgi:hypothetical protein